MMPDLTHQEMKVLSLIIQHNVFKSRRSGDTYLVKTTYGRLKRKRLKPKFIESLIKENLIQLKPPPLSVARYLYIGKWCINQESLKNHPQYKEIVAQIATGAVGKIK